MTKTEEQDLAALLRAHIVNEEDVLALMRDHVKAEVEWRESVTTRLQSIESNHADMRDELQRNTQITSAVHDAYTAGKVATRVIKWVGGIAIAIGSIWWAWKEVVGHADKIGPAP